jgi:hypothetical protein
MKRLLTLLLAFNVSTHSLFAAVDFDGVDDYVQLQASSSLNIVGPITMSAWIKTNSGGVIVVIGGYSSAGGNPGYGLAMGVSGAGKVDIWSGTVGSWIGSNGTVNDNNWRHIAVVASGNVNKWYIDGNLDRTRDNGSSVQPNSYDGVRNIGASTTPSAFFPDQIEEVSIFNRELSADEIQQLYRGKKYLANSIARNNLVGYWPMDEFKTSSTASGQSAIRDYSEYGNNGTPFNSPTGIAGTLNYADFIFSGFSF